MHQKTDRAGYLALSTQIKCLLLTIYFHSYTNITWTILTHLFQVLERDP